jgi:UDP-N-acetylmuramoyl-L-alanyl-D-glutamate--2,6-diaminopimelate ligase
VFTNLTQDHLDFHGTMERYFEAKARMFNDPRLKDSGEKRGLALINRDDPWGEKLIHESLREVWTFGMKVGADFQATDVRIHAAGTDMTIRTPHGKLEIRSPLLGRFNVYNLLAAAGVAFANGVPAEEIEKTLGAPIQVPGRLERVAGNYPVTVLVDYAHTEDALLNILNTIRAISSGRIITVFGCGGERDRGKRPRMGYVAGTLSDRTILTSDNPRGEDPRSIIDEIEAGVRQAGSSRYRICPDRREAIREAISEAASGDCILIAGKGHESSQIIGAETLPFNDLEVAKEMMVARFGS